MATYDELLVISENGPFKNRVKVACIVAAEIVRSESTSVTNHAARVVWAKKVFENPEYEAIRMLWAVLAQNRAATPAQILSATDALIQTAVNDAVNVFAS